MSQVASHYDEVTSSHGGGLRPTGYKVSNAQKARGRSARLKKVGTFDLQVRVLLVVVRRSGREDLGEKFLFRFSRVPGSNGAEAAKTILTRILRIHANVSAWHSRTIRSS